MSFCAVIAAGAACTAVDVDVDVEETLAGESELGAKGPAKDPPIEVVVSWPIAIQLVPPLGTSLATCTRPRSKPADPSVDSPAGDPILQSPNHRSRNGIDLHGRWDPGSSYDELEQSEVPTHFRLAEITKGGRRVGAHVEKGKLMGSFDNGARLVDADWAGAELKVDLLCVDGGWQTFPARIGGVSATGDGYDVEIQDPDRAERGEASWRPACRATLEMPEASWATPFAEVWDERGTRSSSTAHFTFACATSAIIKCDRMGYIDVPDNDDAQRLRQACTRMVRADFSGKDRSATAEGTLIDVEDNRGIQVREQGDHVPVLPLEAVWSPDGAICQNHWRIAGHPNNYGGAPTTCSAEDAALDPSRPHLIRSWSCRPGSLCERQYSSVFLKNWPAPGGLTQWSNVTVVNPNAAEATVKLTVFPTGGGAPLGAVLIKIPAAGAYSTYGDPRWNAIDDGDLLSDRASGWIALSSDMPVVATHRTSLRAGNTWNAPARLVEDEPFLTSPSRRLFSSYYLKSWPEAGGRTQWSNVVVNNPATKPVSITVRIHGVDGSLHELDRALPARGVWNSYGDSDWLAVPNTPTKTGALGWVEIRSDEPVVATNRIVHRDGATYDAPVALLDDVGFAGATSAAKELAASSFLRNIPATGTMTQWSSLIVNNPHPEQVTLTVTVHRNGGGAALRSFTKVIPSFGAWNAYGDPDWTSVPATGSGGRSAGWVEISADLPVFGTNRVVLRDGSTLSSPVALFNDEPLVAPSSDSLVSWPYIKNWPGGEGLTQWSAPVVNNLGGQSATMRVKVWTTDGDLLGELTPTIPAKGSWDAATDLDWDALPHTDGANRRSLGWMTLIPSTPLIATNRLTLREGTTADAPIVLYDATPFVRPRN
ncbi:ADYC domain-containing protein [Sorangium sp. So ce176]|uniref:ADYC domain-containing protein n=1 Tax=Sorangium sp. So ce176 TaxID=3133286 RepID=UPI003F62DB68